MEIQETKTRRYFHESHLPEILLTIGSEIFTGYMTNFSDDEIRIYCTINTKLYTG